MFNSSGMLPTLKIITVITFFIEVTNMQLLEGDSCILNDNSSGVCKELRACHKVYQDLLSGILPTSTCGYKNFDPIVCCKENNDSLTTLPLASVNNTSLKWNSSLESNKDYYSNSQSSPTTDSAINLNHMTTENDNGIYNNTLNRNKPGRLAQKKCAAYARLLYNLVLPPLLAGNRKPVNESLCAIKSQKLIVGGTKAAPKEFPHMAAVGFNSNSQSQTNPSLDKINWVCGGTLVSDRFVLTAAHCTYFANLGSPAWIKVGDLHLIQDNNNAKSQLRKIAYSIRHPDYKKPLEYHDIALLKLDQPVRFDSWVRPACLLVEGHNNVPYKNEQETVQNKKAIATGWGRVDWAEDEGSNDLLKVTLPIVSHETCKIYFSSTSDQLKYGVVDAWQICAGEEGKDTCQGDSGGPLVIFNKQHECMYDVIGVTSLGKLCGTLVPGVYTRVSNYLAWLENTIWSDEK